MRRARIDYLGIEQASVLHAEEIAVHPYDVAEDRSAFLSVIEGKRKPVAHANAIGAAEYAIRFHFNLRASRRLVDKEARQWLPPRVKAVALSRIGLLACRWRRYLRQMD